MDRTIFRAPNLDSVDISGTLSGVVWICEVAGSVTGSEINLCLDLTLRLTRSGSFDVSR